MTDRKIVDYVIVSAASEPLDEKVRLWVSRGYEPFGNPLYINHIKFLAQAMVKYEEIDK